MASSSSYCSSSKSFLLFSVLSMTILVLIYSDVTHARNLAGTNAASVMKENDTLASNYNNSINNQKNDDYGKNYPSDLPRYDVPVDPVPHPRP